MTRNQDLNVLHVADAGTFAASVSGRVVPGDSLIFDFIYFLHPARRHLLNISHIAMCTTLHPSLHLISIVDEHCAGEVADASMSRPAANRLSGNYPRAPSSRLALVDTLSHGRTMLRLSISRLSSICGVCRRRSGIGPRCCSRCTPSCGRTRGGSRGRRRRSSCSTSSACT